MSRASSSNTSISQVAASINVGLGREAALEAETALNSSDGTELSRLNKVYINGTCDLPPCELVEKSRLHSERCRTESASWPLLITGTPRSATVHAQSSLAMHGLEIQDDWREHLPDGRVSWIHAFEDDAPFGPRKIRTGGKKYRHVLHQVKEPLGSLASMCTEPIFKGVGAFLIRHIPLKSYHEANREKGPVCLEFWVQWHTFLTRMRLPTYKIEEVDFRDIFNVSGLGDKYQEPLANKTTKSNARGHRKSFTWQELYTMDPENAAKAWKLAHYYGYRYPDVDFDALTCLGYVPACGGNRYIPWDKCPNGTHPHPTTNTSRSTIVASPREANQTKFRGWVDGGCVEHESGIGIPGLSSENDVRRVVRMYLEPEFMINEYLSGLHEMHTHTKVECTLPDASLAALAIFCFSVAYIGVGAISCFSVSRRNQTLRIGAISVLTLVLGLKLPCL